MRENEEKFKNVFEHTSFGKSLSTIDGYLNVNDAYCKMLGYTKKQMEKIKWKEITYPDDIAHEQELINSLLAGKRKYVRWEKRYIHKNGQIVWADVSTVLQRDKENAPLYFINTINDITEKIQAKEKIIQLNEELEQKVIARTIQLESANKELEAFSYSVSHDLRAPLRAIDGFSRFVLEDYNDILDSEGKRFLGLIRNNTLKMDQLISDLLDFSKIARKELIFSLINMTQMAISMFSESAPEEVRDRIKFRIDQLPEAYGDPAFIKQVWINLFSNAIKFSSREKNPEIIVSSKTEDYSNIFFVKDNGVGFDEKYKDKLYGVFQRLHKSDDFEGTGVGLAIVQRIIHRHGGKVSAESEIGKGATFYFSLPVQNSVWPLAPNPKPQTPNR